MTIYVKKKSEAIKDRQKKKPTDVSYLIPVNSFSL